VFRTHAGELYLLREVPADWGRAWAVSKLTAPSCYHVHVDGAVGSCECKAFLTADNCKHLSAVEAVLNEEGSRMRFGVPDNYPKYPVKPGLPPMPAQIAELPVAPNGYPVPWFVQWVDGAPEFRAMDPKKLVLAIRERRCWVCGHGIPPGPVTFVVGPMCTVNAISAEPPCHHECAVYSARACPFLSKPHMVRRENDLPLEVKDAPGLAIKRNPGVTALYVTSVYQAFREGDGVLFNIERRPHRVEWFREGRPATRAEVAEAFATGCGALKDQAALEGATEEFDKMLKDAERLWPKEEAPAAQPVEAK
jgi:ribosomal protein L24E